MSKLWDTCGDYARDSRLALDPRDRNGKVDPLAPLRRCEDCEHDLGDAIRALRCPLFGKPRAGVEIRCLVFEPRTHQRGLAGRRRLVKLSSAQDRGNHRPHDAIRDPLAAFDPVRNDRGRRHLSRPR